MYLKGINLWVEILFVGVETRHKDQTLLFGVSHCLLAEICAITITKLYADYYFHFEFTFIKRHLKLTFYCTSFKTV